MNSSSSFQIVINALKAKLRKDIDHFPTLIRFLKVQYPASKDLCNRLWKAYEKKANISREEEIKLAFEINQL